MAFSATFTPAMLAALQPLQRSPQRVTISPETVSLLGVRQFYQLVSSQPPAAAVPTSSGLPSAGSAAAAQREAGSSSNSGFEFESKVSGLMRLLGGVLFHQAVVFCNSRAAAEALANRLVAAGYPAAYLSGAHAPQ